MITCFYELRECKERVEPEVVELRQRLKRAQRKIVDMRMEMERQEEYIRAAEEHIVHYVLGRDSKRVWRLHRILEKAYPRGKPSSPAGCDGTWG